MQNKPYTYQKLFDPETFNTHLIISKGKKRTVFILEKLQDILNLEGKGASLHAIWRGCKTNKMIPPKSELEFFQFYFELMK